MHYQPASSQERVQDQIKDRHRIVFDSWDLSKCVSPTYRRVQKELWRAKYGFSVEQTKDGKQVWKQTPIGHGAGGEPFVVDLKTLGQLGVARHRNEKKEISKASPFESMIRSDNYRNEFMLTSSIRSGRSLEAQIE